MSNQGSREFRRACAQFATGVTIVTARSPDGTPVGITVNSFTSVSLEPPLVLVCIDRGSSSYPAFRVGANYAVHVLRHDQSELSTRFATRGIGQEKFAGIRMREGLAGTPILPGYVALFECRAVAVQDGGDHGLFVGQVERVEVHESADPLVFHRGMYVHVDREHPIRVPREVLELWGLGWGSG
jgi:flavin reductase (DIM6/NTAB) family NADH-FMN oxidoreductase RutF